MLTNYPYYFFRCNAICPNFGMELGIGSIEAIIILAPNCAQPLSLAVQGQNVALYGKIDSQTVLRDGLYGLSSRHSGQIKAFIKTYRRILSR